MKRRDKVIRYQVHARRRMQRRGVSEAQVEKALRSPDALRPATREHAKRFEKEISARRRLGVIAEELEREIWVITVFWL